MAIEKENRALSIAEDSHRRDLLLAYFEWWDKLTYEYRTLMLYE